MQHSVLGTIDYQVITDTKVFWEKDFSKAKKLFDRLKKEKRIVKLILEHWEGEIGGSGVHSEDILFE